MLLCGFCQSFDKLCAVVFYVFLFCYIFCGKACCLKLRLAEERVFKEILLVERFFCQRVSLVFCLVISVKKKYRAEKIVEKQVVTQPAK